VVVDDRAAEQEHGANGARKGETAMLDTMGTPRTEPRIRGARPALAWLAAACWALAPGCDCGGGETLDTFTPELRIAPEILDFGDVPVGAAVERGFSLINDGNAPAELDALAELAGAGAPSFALTTAPFPLAGGAIEELGVAFEPTGEGEMLATVELALRAPLAPVSLSLRGRGVTPPVSLAPAEMDFGGVDVGQSASETLVVTNAGDAALRVSLLVEGDGFFLDGQRVRVLDLEPQGQLELAVSFAPSRGGAAEGAVVAELCGAGCGPRVSLSGEGLAPRIEAEPRVVDLGEVPEGQSASEVLTLSNAGVGNLTISSMQALDDDDRVAVTLPPLPLILAGGESAEVEVSYTAAGPDAAVSASILIESNDPLSPRVSVPVTATTPGAALRVVPEAVHYGVLDPGAERSLDVVALASGTAPVTLEEIFLEGPDPDAFDAVVPVATLPLVLEPGEALLVAVEARPAESHSAAGGASARLVFATTEAGAPHSALTFASGDTGCQPRAPVTNLSLGTMRVGLGASGVLEVQNVGDEVCTLAGLGPVAGLPFDSGFSYQATGLDTLGPGETGQLAVGYTAAAEGDASAFFRIAFAEQPEPVLVSATARGVLGALAPEPATVVFGPDVEGCPGRAKVVNFVNDGAGLVTVTDIYLAPEDAAFIVTPGPLPRTVAPGSTLEVRVEPITDAAGAFSAELVVITEELGEVRANLVSTVEEPGALVEEHFLVDDAPPSVDVLFVVDNSGSMFNDQQQLANNFANFIDEAGVGGGLVDFHIGVTSTDVLSPDALEGRLVSPPAVLDGNTPGLEATFADHVALGTDGAGLELGLEAMRLALSEPNLSGANAGFHRAEAALSVIVVTDEDDAGGLAITGELFPEVSRSVESYVAFLSAVKGGVLSNTPVLFSSVSGATPRYQAMVDAFGGVHLDINGEDWGTQLGQLGAATFGLQRAFTLANAAEPGSVVVEVDGQPTTAFSLEGDGDRVVLTDTPPAGAVITVRYRTQCG
jgi:hypothetical protein